MKVPGIEISNISGGNVIIDVNGSDGGINSKKKLKSSDDDIDIDIAPTKSSPPSANDVYLKQTIFWMCEALKTSGVNFIKQTMIGKLGDETNLQLQIKVSQDEIDQLKTLDEFIPDKQQPGDVDFDDKFMKPGYNHPIFDEGLENYIKKFLAQDIYMIEKTNELQKEEVPKAK
ncbi:13415_t:CDS:2 [Entrophospora sp. SA101]|nr:13415_t:CDS:2 [Entrophospora sp. SA101]